MELNEITSQLPPHLMQFVVDQPYDQYTSIDQAVWRYVMRKNYAHLSKVAHESYLDGLKLAGIEVDNIPTMYGMNRILKRIGWAAVAVDGFIPPGAFMEFTAYKVLVIAADIRTLEHIEYTPAPDIIHESAGHAPIIAHPDFAEYLMNIGKAGSKAFSSKKDFELYEAIRHLSIIKEDPATTIGEIEEGERRIAEISSNMGKPSEMALLRNLHWWTVEYGLIGNINNFKIYGAGLLSSIGEGESCLKDDVKKIKYSIESAYCNYDITKPQPQLFVTPDFNYLSEVLNEFEKTMAWKTGGLEGVKKAIDSESIATLTLNSGIQISGLITEYIADGSELIYVKGQGEISYAIENKELPNHNKSFHKNGFDLPLGEIRTINVLNKQVSQITTSLLGKELVLKYDNGLNIIGELVDLLEIKGDIVLIKLKDYQLKYADSYINNSQNSEWIAIADIINSVSAGPADVMAYHQDINVPREKTHKIFYSETDRRLQQLYQKVRDIREGKSDASDLKSIEKELHKNYSDDWLLNLELLELFKDKFKDDVLAASQINYLNQLKSRRPDLTKLINDGMKLL